MVLVWKCKENSDLKGSGELLRLLQCKARRIAGEAAAPVTVEILEYWRFQSGEMTTKERGRCGLMLLRAYQTMCVVKTVMPEQHGCPSPLETSETELSQ